MEHLARDESFRRHRDLIAKVLQLRQDIADAFNLVLDSELDSYYLMVAVVQRYPEAAEQIGWARSTGVVAIADGEVTDAERAELWADYEVAANGLGRAQRGVERAMNYNPQLRNRIEQSVRSAQEKAQPASRGCDGNRRSWSASSSGYWH